jgi:hypothetical protein
MLHTHTVCIHAHCTETQAHVPTAETIFIPRDDLTHTHTQRTRQELAYKRDSTAKAQASGLCQVYGLGIRVKLSYVVEVRTVLALYQ